MITLLQIEFKKAFNYRTFWVITALFTLFIPLSFYSFGQFSIKNFPIDFSQVYAFPKLWHYLAFVGSWVSWVIGILVVILTCNEYRYKTQRQQIINGISHSQSVTAKLILVLFFSIIATLIVAFMGLLFGFTNNSGAMEFSLVTQQIKFLPAFLLQTIGYLSVAFLLASLIRSSALSILAFIFLPILEWMVSFIIPNAIEPYLPMNAFSELTPLPYTDQDIAIQFMGGNMVAPIPEILLPVIVSAFYIVLFSGMTYFLVKKRDV